MRGKGEQIFYEGDKVMIVHLLCLLVGLVATGPLSGVDRPLPDLPVFGKDEMASRLLVHVNRWVKLEGKSSNAFLFMTGQDGAMTLKDSISIRKAVGGLLDNVGRTLPTLLEELLHCERVEGEETPLTLVNNNEKANANYIKEAFLFLEKEEICRDYFIACMKDTNFHFYLKVF